MTLFLIKGGRGGGQGGGCSVRPQPQGGYSGMDYSSTPNGGDPMQAQYGGGMGYNQGCPTSPCGGDPMQAQFGGAAMGYNQGCPTSPCGGDPMQTQFGGGAMGYNQGCPTSPCGGDQYGRGSMAPGGSSMGGDPYATAGGMGSMRGDQYGNANCPISGCIRPTPGNGGMSTSASFARYGSMGGNGSMGGGRVSFQVPCLECGSLPNPACRPPGQDNGSIVSGIPGGGAGMMPPCLECGGIPNPPCMGGGGGGGAGGTGLTPCQECGGMPNPPCGAGTCGGATPCAECAGNPDAPCLNMGPCDYCPEPPPVDDMADKEVFVLKIGKKKEGTDKKPRMELELVTPKAAVVKPIPKMETRDTQYDSKDINGKKGKNGKKKKK